MSQHGKFTFWNRGVCLWLGSVLVIASILLASGERGWWIWCFLGFWFFREAANKRGFNYSGKAGRWWAFDPPYMTMREGCCVRAGAIMVAAGSLGFMLF